MRKAFIAFSGLAFAAVVAAGCTSETKTVRSTEVRTVPAPAAVVERKTIETVPGAPVVVEKRTTTVEPVAPAIIERKTTVVEEH